MAETDINLGQGTVCRINGNTVEIRFKNETVPTIRTGKDAKGTLKYEVEVEPDASKGTLEIKHLEDIWHFDYQVTGNEYPGTASNPD